MGRAEVAGQAESPELAGRRILLVVTGGIAAYKCCQLVRDLRRAGAELRVVMTKAGAEFVSPLTFATLTGSPVGTDLFPQPPPERPIHLAGADCDLAIVAPATADFIAKMALGLGDDLASTIMLAHRGLTLVAPAMNPRMWNSPAVQHNLGLLRARGVIFVGPAEGEMAGVDEEPGPGRMAEPERIVAAAEAVLGRVEAWVDRRVLVTSGPTREKIDPVRFISNGSSGKMGDALARRAYVRGAEVTLIRGVGARGDPPPGPEVVWVDSAAEMFEAVKARFGRCDALLMAAAVADWTPEQPAPSKLKKREGLPRIAWKKTDDILKWAGTHKTNQAVVGFALETDRHLEEARQKLAAKRADLIALNDATAPDSAFGGDTIQITVLRRDGSVRELPTMTKAAAADALLDEVERILPAREG